nr:hypothetical protein [Pyrinomonadaceae bacterium]
MARSVNFVAMGQELLDVEGDYLKAHLRRDAALLDGVLADDFTFTAYG